MTIDVTTPDTAETFWVVADRVRLLGGIDGSDLQMIEVDVPAGSGTPPHTHASAETFYILEGEIVFRDFSGPGAPRTSVAGPGTSVAIPRNAPHNYANESGRAARMLVVLEPAMLEFFREIGTPDPAAPDFGAIGAAMARHGISMLEMAA